MSKTNNASRLTRTKPMNTDNLQKHDFSKSEQQQKIHCKSATLCTQFSPSLRSLLMSELSSVTPTLAGTEKGVLPTTNLHGRIEDQIENILLRIIADK